MKELALLLPPDCGPLTRELFPALRDDAPLAADVLLTRISGLADDALDGTDFQLALWALYELHYRGFEDVGPDWEWDPGQLTVRRALEQRWTAWLHSETTNLVAATLAATGPLPERLFAMVRGFESAPVSAFLRKEASLEQFREFLVHRSNYNLHESDAQVWALPRLAGAAKVGMAELLYDEFGAGRPDRLHSTLFAAAMDAVGLDSTYGAYVHQLPGTTLAITNTMNLFALHRTSAATSVGHFGAFEATSSDPSRQVSWGAERLGLGAEVLDYFDEHVEADSVHEQLMFRTVCGSLVEEDPSLEEGIVLGAAACLVVEDRAGAALLEAWTAGRTSLLALEQPTEVAS